MECIFCQKTFSNKYTLSRHQTTSKNCRRVQDDPCESLFNCKICGKECSSKERLIQHEIKCDGKDYSKLIEKRIENKLIEKEKITRELEEKLAEKDKKIKELEEINSSNLREIKYLEKELKSKDEHIKNILSLATVKKSKRNDIDIEPLDTSIEYINRTILPLINIELIEKGHESIIMCVVDNYLKKDEIIRYKCTDSSRYNFIYKPVGEETIIRDKEGQNICKILRRSDIFNKCREVLKRKENESIYNEFLLTRETEKIKRMFWNSRRFSRQIYKHLS